MLICPLISNRSIASLAPFRFQRTHSWYFFFYIISWQAARHRTVLGKYCLKLAGHYFYNICFIQYCTFTCSFLDCLNFRTNSLLVAQERKPKRILRVGLQAGQAGQPEVQAAAVKLLSGFPFNKLYWLDSFKNSPPLHYTTRGRCCCLCSPASVCFDQQG